jgi:signal transduction histidine kinase/FixJ family two-component response regulator
MGTTLRILIIEDSEDDTFLLLRELARGGYDPIHARVDNAGELQLALAERSWDAITSDYSMPGFSALGALDILQKSGLDIPFIIVSGQIGEDLAVDAMKAGAHDYVMKNNLARLVPAIGREIREAAERRRRREAEEALRTQFLQISTIFDSMNTLIYVADMETHQLLYLNKYGCSLFGSAWEGKPCYTVLQPGQSEPCAGCTNDQLVQEGAPQPPVLSEYQNPITGRWYQCVDRAIHWTDGRVVRMEIAVDITERKEMERIKDEMISAVSHEMRTPLTAMLGFTEFLLENEVDEAQLRSALVTVHKETARLNELISNFLDLQKMKGRREDYALQPVPVLALLQDAAELFIANHDRHRIIVDCPPEVPPVLGDETRLHQVLTNLISNACKYSPRESLIQVGARHEGESVVLWVKDQGIGIPTGLQEQIFERFYRVDNTDRRLVGGTGLGLAVVKEIITAHAGQVWVESTEGVGSTFFVALAAAQAAQQSPQMVSA